MTEVSTKRYTEKHGREPRGRGTWGFCLIAASVTHQDHYRYSAPDTPYEVALADAQRVAGLRRSPRIEVLP